MENKLLKQRKTIYHLIFVRCSVLTCKYDKKDDSNVDEEELEVSKITKDLRQKNNIQTCKCTRFHTHSTVAIDCGHFTYRVEEGDADVLNYAVESHKLEHTKGSDKSSTPLPVKASITLLSL